MSINKFITSAAVLAMVLLAAATVFAGDNKAVPAAEKEVAREEQQKNCEKKGHVRKTRRHKEHDAINKDLLTNLLGIDKDTLNEKLANGANVYDLLKEAGKLEEYKKAMLISKKARLDRLVEHGKITREEADIKLEKYRVKLDNWDGSTNIDNWYGKNKDKN